MKKLLFALPLVAIFATDALATQYNMHVNGMMCQVCVNKVANALKGINGVESVKVNLDQGVVKACVKDNVTLTDAQMKALFLEKGFTYQGMKKQNKCNL